MKDLAAPAPDLRELPRLEQVWARLDLVMDPELDEPVTDMGFIEAVSVTDPGPGSNASRVDVSFRLPTYWCSPNFAFLMAEGIKREIEVLPWVGQAFVELQDHMAAEEMNTVVNSGRPFGAVFADLHPGEDLAALREKFEQKAFQRRQEVVINALVVQGYSPERLVDLTIGELEGVVFDDDHDTRQKARYMALLKSRLLAEIPTDPALQTWAGAALTSDGFQTYMDLLRSIRINMEFSGALCRGLKASRYRVADLSGETPVLVDLITGLTADHACR